MNNNASRLFYAKYMLKNQLKNQCNNPEHLSVIAECIKTREIESEEECYKTKEQLFVLGFYPLEVHKFYNCVNKDGYSNWSLKKNIWINDKKITSTRELIEILQNTNYRIAS